MRTGSFFHLFPHPMSMPKKQQFKERYLGLGYCDLESHSLLDDDDDDDK
jgi:hypothetical protein